jgi:2-polyprenyl-6-methoxyphenol hydroxylase-like FAD-dependent oxidoreductase
LRSGKRVVEHQAANRLMSAPAGDYTESVRRADAPESVTTSCCIVGAGPAGLMLGLLLARAGVDVLVLEKHRDFLRDFRGDMIHPATLELMDDLGLLEQLLALPHQKLPEFVGLMGSLRLPMVDFTGLPTRCKFLVNMPQWEFLAFMRHAAAEYPNFRLRMQSDAVALIERDRRVVGVEVEAPRGRFAVHADLTVCADGRRSLLRELAGLQVEHVGTTIDALWMKITRRAEDGESLRRFAAGHILVNLDRDDYWQCALVIPKGTFAAIKDQGLARFRGRIGDLVPAFRDRLEHDLAGWDDVKLLDVAINRLPQWHRPGLLCIGDAAHAMSPTTGVGINLAIQDAVAAANILSSPLLRGAMSDHHLRRVQRSRALPTRAMQVLQGLIERKIVVPVLNSRELTKVPWSLRLLRRSRTLRRLLGRIIGLGFGRERVKQSDAPRRRLS